MTFFEHYLFYYLCIFFFFLVKWYILTYLLYLKKNTRKIIIKQIQIKTSRFLLLKQKLILLNFFLWDFSVPPRISKEYLCHTSPTHQITLNKRFNWISHFKSKNKILNSESYLFHWILKLKLFIHTKHITNLYVKLSEHKMLKSEVASENQIIM